MFCISSVNATESIFFNDDINGPHIEISDVQNNVKLALWEKYNGRVVNFGEELDYTTLVNTIKNADTRIQNVALDIPYYSIRRQNVNTNENELMTNDEKVDLIKVLVDGNNITENVTKVLSEEKSIENGIEYTLEITGIIGDGYVSIVIPENTLEDLGKTTSDAEGNKNITTTFTTTIDDDTDADIDIEADNTDPILESIEIVNPQTETYKAGQEITIVATYNEDIYGETASINKISESTAPVLNIRFGESDERVATYVGSTERTITYTYTVQSGDDGILEITSYVGTVWDRAGNDLILNSRRILDGYVITADTTRPEIEEVKVISPNSGTYKAEQIINIEVVYSEDVYGVSRSLLTESSAPVLNIKFGDGEERQTTFVPKDTKSNVLTYTYTIKAGDNGILTTSSYTGTVYDVSKTTEDSNGNLLEVSNQSLSENSKEIIADTTVATLQSINVINPVTELYKEGQVITLEAIFDENVYGRSNTTLTESTAPTLKVKFVEGNVKTATFKDASDNKVRYTCTVENGDNGILNFVSYVGTIYDTSKTEII